MSTYKKFNKDWWHRRFQAHEYLNKINLKRNYQINKKLDYYITNLANKFLKINIKFNYFFKIKKLKLIQNIVAL